MFKMCLIYYRKSTSAIFYSTNNLSWHGFFFVFFFAFLFFVRPKKKKNPNILEKCITYKIIMSKKKVPLAYKCEKKEKNKTKQPPPRFLASAVDFFSFSFFFFN